jgi:hypothetical protein
MPIATGSSAAFSSASRGTTQASQRRRRACQQPREPESPLGVRGCASAAGVPSAIDRDAAVIRVQRFAGPLPADCRCARRRPRSTSPPTSPRTARSTRSPGPRQLHTQRHTSIAVELAVRVLHLRPLLRVDPAAGDHPRQRPDAQPLPGVALRGHRPALARRGLERDPDPQRRVRGRPAAPGRPGSASFPGGPGRRRAPGPGAAPDPRAERVQIGAVAALHRAGARPSSPPWPSPRRGHAARTESRRCRRRSAALDV